MYPVSRITGEGKAALLWAWGPRRGGGRFEKERGAGGGVGGNSVCVRKLKIPYGDKSDGHEKNASVYVRV